MGVHDIQLPFGGEAGTVLDKFARKAGSGGERGEEEDHAEGVVNVPESIDEGRVSGNSV